MNILYLTQYFPPEIGAGENRAFEMVKNLKSLGHKITVITEFPNYPSGIIPKKYNFKLFEKRRAKGIEVIRCYVKASPHRSFKNRILFYLTFMLNSILAGVKLRIKFDLVYATSPPLFVGLAGYLLSRIRNLKFVFEVRDIWPDSAVALGELKNKITIKLSRRIEELCYNKAQKIITVTQGIAELIQKKGINSKKIKTVYNAVNLDLFEYQEDRTIFKKDLGIDEKFLVLYAGNMGLAQGMEELIEAVALMKGEENIKFIFIGNGPRKNSCKNLCKKYHLNNLHFLNEKPRTEIIKYIYAADVCLVPLRKKEIFKFALPSKMFEAWACGRPIVLSVDGEAKEHLQKAQAGVWAEPENVTAIKDAILFLYNHPSLCKEFGKNGRSYVEKYFSRKIQAERLEKILVKILKDD